MDDALGVRFLERLTRLRNDAQRTLRRNLAQTRNLVRQRSPMEILHGNKQQSFFGFAKVDHPHRVGMIESSRSAGFIVKALHPLRIRRDVRA